MAERPFVHNAPLGVWVASGLAANDTTDAITFWNERGAAMLSIGIVANGGAGFNGGTVIVELSFDGVVWLPARTVSGSAAELAAPGYVELSTGAPMVRARAGAGVGNVRVMASRRV